MRRIVAVAALAVAATLSGACAGSRDPDTVVTPGTNRRVVTYQEIQEGIAQNYGSAYQLLQSRRSEWFIPTPTGSRGQTQTPSVWLDQQRLGDLSTLRSIPLTAIIEIRLLPPSEAQSLLGLNNLGGAIVARTR